MTFLPAVSFVIAAAVLLLAVRRLCGFHRRKANAEEREPDSAESGLQGRNQRKKASHSNTENCLRTSTEDTVTKRF